MKKLTNVTKMYLHNFFSSNEWSDSETNETKVSILMKLLSAIFQILYLTHEQRKRDARSSRHVVDTESGL